MRAFEKFVDSSYSEKIVIAPLQSSDSVTLLLRAGTAASPRPLQTALVGIKYRSVTFFNNHHPPPEMKS
jgi:hypothetical protein